MICLNVNAKYSRIKGFGKTTPFLEKLHWPNQMFEDSTTFQTIDLHPIK